VEIVRVAFVNVRAEPNGEVVGQIENGTSVLVIECIDDWCQIEADKFDGYVFRGCLTGNEDLGCTAK
jgi:SH3-like domain-containing protein